MNASNPIIPRNYVYVRIDDATKEKIKDAAHKDGSNMTIWIRQVIMRELAKL